MKNTLIYIMFITAMVGTLYGVVHSLNMHTIYEYEYYGAYSRCQAVCKIDSLVYLGGSYKMHVINAIDPYHPACVGSVSISSDEILYSPLWPDYLFSIQTGIGIISIEDPVNPEVVNVFYVPDELEPAHLWGVSINPPFGFAATDDGLFILGLSAPESLIFSQFDTTASTAVFFEDSILYVGGVNSLRAFIFTPPDSLILLSSIETKRVLQIIIKDEFAILLLKGSYLEPDRVLFVNISDPSSPYIIDSVIIETLLEDIPFSIDASKLISMFYDTENNMLLFHLFSAGVIVTELTPTKELQLLGYWTISYVDPFGPWGFQSWVEDSFVFLTAGDRGFYILELEEENGLDEISDLTTFTVCKAHPNPFNSACRITAPEGAIVEIFDIDGRSVASFQNTDNIWQPDASIGSGVYLIRARFGNESVAKRVVYLK